MTPILGFDGNAIIISINGNPFRLFRVDGKLVPMADPQDYGTVADEDTNHTSALRRAFDSAKKIGVDVTFLGDTAATCVTKPVTDQKDFH